MNIFKVLSGGDGVLLEPNVSAFLAFLLDPKQAHGLGSTFLSQVISLALRDHPNRDMLAPILPKGRNQILDLSLNSSFTVEVDTEVTVGVRGGAKKHCDIDVVIEISKTTEVPGHGAKSILEEFVLALSVENKIRDAAIEEGQLLQELEGLSEFYRESKSVPTCGTVQLLITPSFSERATMAFQRLKSAMRPGNHACHFVWSPVSPSDISRREFSIYSNLAELLRMDHGGEVDPLHEHTKYIIKSFMSFIRSGFRSYEDESVKSTKVKDHSKYEFGGAVYTKCRLVLAVVGEYVRSKKPTFRQLLNDFPDTIMRKKWRLKGLICRAEEALPRRYFVEDSELLTTDDAIRIAVNSQWDLDGIQPFIEHAKRLGFAIKKVT